MLKRAEALRNEFYYNSALLVQYPLDFSHHSFFSLPLFLLVAFASESTKPGRFHIRHTHRLLSGSAIIRLEFLHRAVARAFAG